MRINLENPINWQHPLNRGLLHWWITLPGQGPGPYLPDIVKGNPKPGTLTNMPNGGSWGNYQSGHGRVFDAPLYDGTNDYAACGDIDDLEGVTALSIDAYVNSTTLSGGTDGLRYIISKEDGGGFIWILRQLTGGDKIQWFVFDGTIRGPQETTGFTANEWHHLCATYGSGVGLDIYRNGVASSSTGFAAVGTLSTSTAVVSIGSLAANTGRAWSGRLPSIRATQRRYTQDESWQLYQEAEKGWPNLLNHVPNRTLFLPTGASDYITGNVVEVDQEFIGESPYILGTDLTASAVTGGDIPSEVEGEDIATSNSVDVIQQLITVLTIPILTQNVIAVEQSIDLIDNWNTENEVAVGTFCNLYLGDAPNVLIGNRYRR